MADEDLQNELNHLSEKERVEAKHLLKIARAYVSSRPNFKPTEKEIDKAIEDSGVTSHKEKGELFNKIRRKLRTEANEDQQGVATETHRRLKRKLSKSVRVQLGIKNAGRPEGSKNKDTKYSKKDLDKNLRLFINNYFEQEGKNPTQEKAAKALNLGYAKALHRLRERYGDKRAWRQLVRDILESE